jgi:hypothetical protein
MPKFSKEDFTQDNATRLMVIIMSKMGRPPLTQFRDLPPTQQTKFNRFMNEYIQGLGEEWEVKLLADFNLIVNENILNEEFDPSRVWVKEVITERNVLLSEEQQEWIKKTEEETGEPVVY